MTRQEALNNLETLKGLAKAVSHSDDFLAERKCTTREYLGLGYESHYGILMVPEDTVIAMCEALLYREAGEE